MDFWNGVLVGIIIAAIGFIVIEKMGLI